MRVRVLEGVVRQNVILFMDVLSQAEQKSLTAKKTFRAWLHCRSGELFFTNPSEGRECKPVFLNFCYDPVQGEIQLFIQEKKDSFFLGDLSPNAQRVFQETMRTFTEIALRLKGPSDLKTKLSVLSHLIVDIILPADRNVLMAAWHLVDRMQAESLLENLPSGTFLFRKDSFTEVLEDQLKEQLKKPIKCFTLTLSHENHIISDYTLVYVDGRWQIYDDDPLLQQPSFPNLKSLLSSFQGNAKYPLYQEIKT